MNNEFLLEIGTEEIPAGYIKPALNFMKERMTKELQERSLSFTEIITTATPRRLALCVSGLDTRQPDRREEVMGPPKKAAYDKDGQPTKAALGFAKSRGASIEDVQIVSTKKGDYLMVVQEHTGEDTAHLLSVLLPDFILSIPFPKSMHWGNFRTTFARPLQWLVALFNEKVVDFTLNDLVAGNTTRGHRFMSSNTVEVRNFDSYLQALRGEHVIADIEERRRVVESEVATAADQSGNQVVPDSDLLDTITNLVEFPVGVAGRFDTKFLTLPREVLITSMRVHQKYFTVADASGDLLPHFVAVNNTKIADTDMAAAGHERVLRARLEDALFFYSEDQQQKLADRLDNLSGVIFQAQLGTMLEKTARMEKLTAFLSQKLAPELQEQATRAARLAKADLVTGMVGEFPSLQGVMGKYYAQQEGEETEVATAIQEHYLPLRADSALPKTVCGALVSMADRLDTIAGCFGIGKVPTGTTDPYALRRHSLALLHIISGHSFSISLNECIDAALELYGDKLTAEKAATARAIHEFIKARYMNDLVAKGTAAEAVEAALATSFDDISDCRKRIDALIAISAQEAFTVLAGSFKRVINIIKDHANTTVEVELLLEEAEKNLHGVYLDVAATVTPLIAEKNYDRALQKILDMKEPVDNFFDTVMVMSEDEKIKENRLSLLTAIAHLFLQIGDFSKMYTIAER